MFIMMNAARLGVGLQGLAQGEVAYQNAAAYAKDRRQGRALKPEDRDPDAKADNLLVHPDVRRMLLEARAWNEAARALVLWGSLQVDLARHSPDEAERERAEDLVGLLTPVIKSYLTDKGFAGRGRGAAGVRRPRLYPRTWHGTVRPRRPHRPDLRRHQRRPGDGPGRPQAAARERPRRSAPCSRPSRPTSPRPRRRAIRPGSRPRSSPRSPTSRRRPCGLPRTAWPTPTMPAPGAYAYQDLMGLVAFGWMWLKLAERGQARDRRGPGRAVPRHQAPPRRILRQARALGLNRAPSQGRGRRRDGDAGAGRGVLVTTNQRARRRLQIPAKWTGSRRRAV